MTEKPAPWIAKSKAVGTGSPRRISRLYGFAHVYRGARGTRDLSASSTQELLKAMRRGCRTTRPARRRVRAANP